MQKVALLLIVALVVAGCNLVPEGPNPPKGRPSNPTTPSTPAPAPTTPSTPASAEPEEMDDMEDMEGEDVMDTEDAEDMNDMDDMQDAEEPADTAVAPTPEPEPAPVPDFIGEEPDPAPPVEEEEVVELGAIYKPFVQEDYDNMRGVKAFALYFGADDCSECIAFSNAAAAAVDEMPKDYPVMEVAFGSNTRLERRFDVTEVNTVVVFDAQGVVVLQKTAPTVEDLKAAVFESVE